MQIRRVTSLGGLRLDKLLLTLIMAAFVLVWAYPMLLTIATSLKSDAEVVAGPLSLPTKPSFEAYSNVLNFLDFGRMLWNSFLISFGGSALAVLLAVFPAYALSRFEIPGGEAIFIILLTGLMIPQQSVIIPLYNLLEKLKLLDSLWGLGIIHGVYGIPYVMFILRGYMVGINRELELAARVDGCSDIGVFWHIILPLIVPGIAVAGTLNIISVWNELFFAFIFLTETSKFPVSVGLTIMRRGRYFMSWNMPAAAIVLGQLPTVILYILAYRYIKQGIFAGAVKG